jgi:hypothetical membrane protein
MDARMRAHIAQAAALVGVAAIAVGSLVTALVYTGSRGEAYSPFNHWVSELGQTSVSQASLLFNVGLFVSGLCFAVFMALFAASGTGRPRHLWGFLGIVGGVSGALVGVFPMDQLQVHGLVAMGFFFLGPSSVALASLDLLRRHDPRLPRWVGVLGIAVVVVLVLFLVSLVTDPIMRGGDALAAPDQRPAFWLASTLEWAVVVGVLLWTFLAAVSWIRADRLGARAR